MSNRIDYVYMVATSFSGSTLLAMLLDTHPRIISIGEVANTIHRTIGQDKYSEYPCSCGKPIRHCDFFSLVREHCYNAGVELDLHDFRTGLGEKLPQPLRRLVFGTATHHFWLQRTRDRLMRAIPPYRKHLNRVFKRTEVIARTALEISGKDIFVDGSKGCQKAFHLTRMEQLDLRIIHLMRDARAYIYSCQKRGIAQAVSSARSWRRTQMAALELKKGLPSDRYYLLRWEEFCQNPEASLQSLFEFMRVESVDVLSSFNNQSHHVIGNILRLKQVREIRSNERWRDELTENQLSTYERIAGDLNRSLGYD